MHIIEIQTFPPIDFFKLLVKKRYIKIERYESYLKTSFRNRYTIGGANGAISLTIPLMGGREQKAKTADILIDHSTEWQMKHWRGIVSGYRKAPFFEYYADGVKSLLFSKEASLFTFSYKTIEWAAKQLKLDVELSFTNKYLPVYQDGDDRRNTILPGNFQNEGKSWEPKYSQVFEDRFGFQSNLSILDMLFCAGPHSKQLLEKSVKK